MLKRQRNLQTNLCITVVLCGAGVLACEGDDAEDSAAAEGAGDGKADGLGETHEVDVCPSVPACDAPLPDLGPRRSFRHLDSRIVAASGAPNPRGRDLILRPGDAQVVIGKVTYGVFDTDLEDEEVDVWLLRGCGTSWEKLGTALTTEEGDHVTVEGVADSGGRVYFEIPADRTLEPGRHRIRLSVAGDRSGADVFIQVAPEGTSVVVSDVDGTLTTSETEEYGALLVGALPNANPGAADVFQALADRGHLLVYLTARGEFLVGRTRQFLAARGFPPGIVHTTTEGIGALGSAATTFKAEDLDRSITARGYVPALAFGNTATDADAYDAADIQPIDHRLFFRFDDEHGGRRFDDYADLLPEVEGTPGPCD